MYLPITDLRQQAPAAAVRQQKVTLSLTHRCNLACRYCYAGSSTKPDMSPETLARALDFAWRVSTPAAPLEVAFFGGEPLLRPDLIRLATAGVQARQAVSPRTVSYNVTTNGTILDDELLELLQRERIRVCVSVDGPPSLHDGNRPFRGGKGSAALVLKHLARLLSRLPDVQINAVFGPATVDRLPETVAFLVEAGAGVIHLNPDIRADWPPAVLERIGEVFHRLAEFYIATFRRGRELALSVIDNKINLFLKGGYEAHDRCGMGRSEWGIAAGGNVYPCERFIGEDDDPRFLLGNVHGEVRPLPCTPVEWPRAAERETSAPDCTACAAREYCMHWCGCTNFHLGGRADRPSDLVCAIEKASLKAARHAMKALSAAEDPLFYRHYLAYLEYGCPPAAASPPPVP